MNKARLNNLDTTNFGHDSHWSSIAVDDSVAGVLFDEKLLCSAFALYDINHVGLMEAKSPFEVMRFNQSGTFFMACVEGEGEVLIDGSWRRVVSGEACLLPAYAVNGLRAIEGHVWEFAWVRYVEDKNKKHIANSELTVRGVFDCDAVVAVINGLIAELDANPHEPVVSSWVCLLHQQVLKFAKPSVLDDRLAQIWTQVKEDISKDWTLFELAQIGFISEEHLRRLNNKQLGRSPMQHLIYLRMLKARQLLLNTNDTLESICHDVGYKSPFSFSNTFNKWMGCRPSSLR